MKQGTRVGFARPFLQSVTGGDPTSDMWHRRGMVEGTSGRMVFVRWDGEWEITRILAANIAELGSFNFAHADAKGWIGYGGLGEKPRSPWKGST